MTKPSDPRFVQAKEFSLLPLKRDDVYRVFKADWRQLRKRVDRLRSRVPWFGRIGFAAGGIAATFFATAWAIETSEVVTIVEVGDMSLRGVFFGLTIMFAIIAVFSFLVIKPEGKSLEIQRDDIIEIMDGIEAQHAETSGHSGDAVTPGQAISAIGQANARRGRFQHFLDEMEKKEAADRSAEFEEQVKDIVESVKRAPDKSGDAPRGPLDPPPKLP